ncbi:MAG: exodeoxyribonuclease VII large subunit [Candidatus Latescibacterota bacterium]|nr:MAG: exodeoxyribonuclease VII large subunit [Candidatus Latescibacterota bacterium]
MSSYLRGPYTVSEITRRIKGLLETSLPTVWIQGEISNFTWHSSGHLYFTLKDEYSQLRCVMWRERSQRLFFTPQNGMKVLAQGDITVYERAGQYQLTVRQLQPAGIGELELAFEQLKERLRAEGLFDEKHKRSLPEFPQTIGVVTSPTGAAIRDIAQIIGRRAPWVQVILRPTLVQGEGAAADIAQAIDEFNQYGKVDLLIVGRGGGSLEELWAFNEEMVARAIYRSRIPVISAVGHEVDFTIADFVADRRAPTPSAAAELAVRDRAELQKLVRLLQQQAADGVLRKIKDAQTKVHALGSSYAIRRFEDSLEQQLQRVDELSGALIRGLDHIVVGKIGSFREVAGKLDVLSPLSAFQRGFCICQRLPEMTVVKESTALRVADMVKLRFKTGSAFCEVESVE